MARKQKSEVAHNRSVAPGDSEYQVGGSTMLILGDVTFRISAQGADSRNLGRWSYITLTGKNSVTTTIFTCYCPCRSTSIGSVFAQQLLYISMNKQTLPKIDCPRQLFGYDLKNEIENKQDQGHNILMLGDVNSCYADLTTWMQELGLHEFIERRGSHTNSKKRKPVYSDRLYFWHSPLFYLTKRLFILF